MNTPTANALLEALHALSPSHIELVNESHMHAHFFEGKESHFKLTIVSDAFNGLRLAARHQAIYARLGSLLTSGGGTVHALAIHAYTPDEWGMLGQAPSSPVCASKRH
ncbi:BolA family transcriptional regulator [Moraxella sp.]|uniref:BolA family protein n=1 Tax=Moraxella sp. TaxID=479 RepID=UPI0026DD08C4|nr:BolA family protein [Moraxella sp.]MDO4894745.1 BolA family protein [Moraxella sp.]